MENVISLDAEKASRYIGRAFDSYLRDPPDSDFQKGHLSALITLYTEGLDKGENDARIALLEKMT